MFSAHFLWNRKNLPGCFLFAWPLPTYKACLWSAFREYHGDVPWRFVDFGPYNEMIRDSVQVAQRMLCFSQGNLLLMDVKLSELAWRLPLGCELFACEKHSTTVEDEKGEKTSEVQHAKRIPRKICDLAHWENVGTEHIQVEMHSTHTSLFLTLFCAASNYPRDFGPSNF